MQRKNVNLSVLNAEFYDGNRIRQPQGEKKAGVEINSLLNDLSSIVWSSNGGNIRSFDNRLMCTFYSADNAVIAAATMHRFAFALPPIKSKGSQSIRLRIRIGTGSVLREGNDLYGNAVNFASNMKSMAHPFQTLISESTCNNLSRDYANQTRFVGQWSAKDRHRILNVFEYIVDMEDPKLSAKNPPNTKQPKTLDLILGSTILTVDDHYPVCTIGRQTKNDIVMKYPRVSRWHAKVEKRDRKFILRDTSFNGSYVKIDNLDTVHISNDEIRLIGKGVIFPGREATPSSPEAIHFNLR